MTSQALYHREVLPYIHSSQRLDLEIKELWEMTKEVNPDMASAYKLFDSVVLEAKKIGNVGETYSAHCKLVAKKVAETVDLALKNYPSLAEHILNRAQMELAGLLEDSIYLVGGNGKNNPNKLDSNPVHEILTYFQLIHLDNKEFAEAMALHFVAPQILALEKRRSKFLGMNPKPDNLSLKILTAVDALCTIEWLPDSKGSFENAIQFRISDIIQRRGGLKSTHPLVLGLINGGEERLKESVRIIKGLREGTLSTDQIKAIIT